MSTAYIATMVKENDVRALRRALYSSTEMFNSESHGGRFYAVLRVTADSPERVRYLAEYQVGRLQSFPFFASAQETYDEAESVLTQLIRDRAEMFEVES